MSVVTWGLLAKSQVDDETIEEAIARLILVHNEDETAHLGSGQSLQSHKASEIIDHVVDSIVADKIAFGQIDLSKLSADKFIFLTHFESLDSIVERYGTFALKTMGIKMATSAVLNNEASMALDSAVGSAIMNFSRNLFFQSSFKVLDTTAQVVYIKIGVKEGDDYDDGFGFKIVDNTLYALHMTTVAGSPVEYTTEITGITLNTMNVYRAFYNYTAGEIKFYVNGVLRATHNSNLPVSPNSDFFFTYIIKTTSANIRWLYIADLLFTCDK